MMCSGKIEYKDSVGNQGVIMDGGIQWMTAGQGIVHSVMPVITTGDLWGFQLWINLPKKDKMIKHRYQDIQAAEIPTVTSTEGASVRVMSGSFGGKQGPVDMRHPGLLMDVSLKAGGTFQHTMPSEWNAFAYVFIGSGTICGSPAPVQHAMVLSKGDAVTASTEGELRFLLIAGIPIGEPIVQHGPFVMNTKEEIMQAFADYRSGMLQNPDDNIWEDWQ